MAGVWVVQDGEGVGGLRNGKVRGRGLALQHCLGHPSTANPVGISYLSTIQFKSEGNTQVSGSTEYG